jgi:hypothetical protein
MAMHGKKAGLGSVKKTGNTWTLVRGDRVEWEPRGALPAREIKRMVGNQGEGESEEQREERQRRESFEGASLSKGSSHSQKQWAVFAVSQKREEIFWGHRK